MWHRSAGKAQARLPETHAPSRTFVGCSRMRGCAGVLRPEFDARTGCWDRVNSMSCSFFLPSARRLAALELGPCFCIVISGAEARGTWNVDWIRTVRGVGPVVLAKLQAELRCRPELLGIAELLRGVEDLEKGPSLSAVFATHFCPRVKTRGEEHVLPPAIRQLLLEAWQSKLFSLLDLCPDMASCLPEVPCQDFNATEHAYEPDLVHRRFLIRAKSVPAGHSALVPGLAKVVVESMHSVPRLKLRPPNIRRSWF